MHHGSFDRRKSVEQQVQTKLSLAMSSPAISSYKIDGMNSGANNSLIKKIKRRMKEVYVSQYQEIEESRFIIREMKPAVIHVRAQKKHVHHNHHQQRGMSVASLGTISAFTPSTYNNADMKPYLSKEVNFQKYYVQQAVPVSESPLNLIPELGEKQQPSQQQ